MKRYSGLRKVYAIATASCNRSGFSNYRKGTPARACRHKRAKGIKKSLARAGRKRGR